MRIVARAIFVATGVVGLIGSARAADMTGAEIKAFLSGKTMYLETTAASSTGKAGQGVIYWADDGTALYKTPMGTMWHGKWEIKGTPIGRRSQTIRVCAGTRPATLTRSTTPSAVRRAPRS